MNESDARSLAVKATLADELIDAVGAAVEFDYLQHQGASAEGLSGVVRTFLEDVFIDEVLVDRRIVRILRDHLPDGDTVVLVGSTGGGKTCALMALKRLIELETPQRWHMVTYNGNSNAANLSGLKTLEEKKHQIVSRISQRIVNRYIGDEHRWDWNYHLFSTAHQFDGLLDVFGDEVGSPEDLYQVTRPGGLGADAWLRAKETFDSTPALEKLGLVLSYLHKNDVRLVLTIDNCDQLSDLDFQAAKAAASDLRNRTHQALPLIVAARPPTRKRIKNHLDFGDPKIVQLNEFDSDGFLSAIGNKPIHVDATRQDLEHAKDIFQARLAVFEDQRLVDRINDHLQDRFGQRLTLQRLERSHLSAFRKAADKVLEDYLTFKPEPVSYGFSESFPDRASARQLADLTRTFIMWHNGSLRELGASFFDYSKRLHRINSAAADITDDLVISSGSIPQSESGRGIYSLAKGGDVRTIMFRHVLFYGTSEDDAEDNYLRIHPSLRLFEPDFRGGNADFTFLRARLLQYLLARVWDQRPVTIGDITKTFKRQFLVSEDAIVGALEDLWERDGYLTGLIKVDGLDSPPIYGDQTDEFVMSPGMSVSLTSAGHILISRLVYVVEFLYWSAVTEPDARRVIKDQLERVGERQLRDPEWVTLAANRAEVAASYVCDVLLPRFEVEHPYISTSVQATDDQVRRLFSFCSAFGFGPGNWHLTRAVDQLERFIYQIDDNGDFVARFKVSDSTVARLDKIHNATDQLDHVFNKGRLLAASSSTDATE